MFLDLHRSHSIAFRQFMLALEPEPSRRGFRIKGQTWHLSKGDRTSLLHFNIGCYPGETSVNCTAYVTFSAVVRAVNHYRRAMRGARASINPLPPTAWDRTHVNWTTTLFDFSDVSPRVMADCDDALAHIDAHTQTIGSSADWISRRLADRKDTNLDQLLCEPHVACLFVLGDRSAFDTVVSNWLDRYPDSINVVRSVTSAAQFFRSRWDDPELRGAT